MYTPLKPSAQISQFCHTKSCLMPFVIYSSLHPGSWHFLEFYINDIMQSIFLCKAFFIQNISEVHVVDVSIVYSLLFLSNIILFLFLFFKERETSMCGCLSCVPPPSPTPMTWPTTQACALTGNPTHDPLVSGPVLNPLSHISQGLSNILLYEYTISYFFISW